MKRAWFQRIRGGGCQTLVMGEKPMFCHLFLFYQPLPTSLMFCWVVEQLWLLVVGIVIAEVVVAVEDCQSLCHTPTPPTTVRSSPHALFPCQIIFLMRLAFTTTAIFFVVWFLLARRVVVCSCSRAGTLRWFCSRREQEKSRLSLGILRCRSYFTLRDSV